MKFYDFPGPGPKFHDLPGLESKLSNSMTFQVFQDSYEPWAIARVDSRRSCSLILLKFLRRSSNNSFVRWLTSRFLRDLGRLTGSVSRAAAETHFVRRAKLGEALSKSREVKSQSHQVKHVDYLSLEKNDAARETFDASFSRHMNSQLLIYTAESTGASMDRTKMPNLRNGSKGGFEPGLT